jgi:acyl carrier protein
LTEIAFTRDLIAFVEKLSDVPPGTITAHTPLIDAGYIDSFSIMQIILFIEERCGVSITIDSLSLDTVATVEIITDTYAAHLKAVL